MFWLDSTSIHSSAGRHIMISSASLAASVEHINSIIWSWPLDIFIICAGLIMTVALGFIQFRYFGAAWKAVFVPEKGELTDSYITPFQAFVNTLSASVGNGSLAGMATAVYAGGPGAGFWVFILGFFNMAIRFAEVFASTEFTEKSATGALRGGPMVYLKKVPAGAFLASLYAFFCLGLTFVSGNAVQCNAITTGVHRMSGLDVRLIALMLFALVLYIMFGGAKRIIYYSELIIPIKVGLFFGATIFLLVYHYQNIIPAFHLIFQSALTPKAVTAGLLGFTMQDALKFGIENPIRFGVARSLNATETGLGTAAILYGSTASKNPFRSGLMSMASAFISNHLVCFMLIVALVASGVWNSDNYGINMSILAYSTVFSTLGGWIVTFLSVSFGLGVLVAYAYIGRECWMYLFKGQFAGLYTAIYCGIALVGALYKAEVLWSALDIVNAGLIVINVLGLMYLLPQIRKAIRTYEK